MDNMATDSTSTPSADHDPIDPHHWHLHITTFWVLLLIGVLLMVVTVVLAWCSSPGYVHADWGPVMISTGVVWARTLPPDKPTRVHFASDTVYHKKSSPLKRPAQKTCS
jgi:hypothetical protein